MASTSSSGGTSNAPTAPVPSQHPLASASSRPARRALRNCRYSDEDAVLSAENDPAGSPSSHSDERKRLKNRKAQASFVERKKQMIARLEARIVDLERAATGAQQGACSSLTTCATVESIKETVEIMSQKWAPLPPSSAAEANKSRRQLQNRHAQQLSRYRRDAYISLLEDKVAQLESAQRLAGQCVKLEMPENDKFYFAHQHQQQHQHQHQQQQHQFNAVEGDESASNTDVLGTDSPNSSGWSGTVAAAAEGYSDGLRIEPAVTLPSFSTLIYQLRAMSEASAHPGS
ncbi:hypothetical protein BJ741DRAFT_684660 [Chytriomyces cf. hyalinus JEL632]|nr:hypothetical protein BJ741DRAFT_684660 [Chytriomyces cf. hyalinus JEL632]